jgi:hypothetical protein
VCAFCREEFALDSEKGIIVATTPKKPWVAFLLSILLTGAGLAYLGKWGWAALNFVAALGIGILVALTFPDASSPVGIGILVGSAVMAKNLAEKMNKESIVGVPAESTGMMAPAPVIVVPEPKPVEPIVVKPSTLVCPKCGSTTEPCIFCCECGSPLS